MKNLYIYTMLSLYNENEYFLFYHSAGLNTTDLQETGGQRSPCHELLFLGKACAQIP